MKSFFAILYMANNLLVSWVYLVMPAITSLTTLDEGRFSKSCLYFIHHRHNVVFQENSPENYKRASKIFNIDSELVTFYPLFFIIIF